MFHTGATVTEEMFGYLFQSLYNKEDEKNLVSKTDLQSILGDPQSYSDEIDLPTRMSNAEKQFDHEVSGSLAEALYIYHDEVEEVKGIMIQWMSYMERFADMMGLEWDAGCNGTHAQWLELLWNDLAGQNIVVMTQQPVLGGYNGLMWDTSSTGLSLPRWLESLYGELVSYGIPLNVSQPALSGDSWKYEAMNQSISNWLYKLWLDIDAYFAAQGWALSVCEPRLVY